MSGAGGTNEAPAWDTMVLVGTVARPHGVRGDVVINPETDFVAERFAVGRTVWTTAASGAVIPLTIARASLGGRRPVVGFQGTNAVPDAERLAGAELRVPEASLVPLAPGTYYLHQLVGCRVESTAGETVGEVVRVDGGVGASLLVIAGERGEVLVPFVAEMCRVVDVEARLIRVEPPEGLLEVNAPVSPRPRTPRTPRTRTTGSGPGPARRP